MGVSLEKTTEVVRVFRLDVSTHGVVHVTPKLNFEFLGVTKFLVSEGALDIMRWHGEDVSTSPTWDQVMTATGENGKSICT